MKRTSTSYIGTFDPLCAGDIFEIENLKKAIKAVNETNKMMKNDQRFRVVLRGRKPIEKQVINTMPWGTGLRKESKVSYDYFGNIVGGIANASKYDVYVYTR